MERRVLIAIFLSFLVLYAYQALFVTTPSPTTGPTTAPAATEKTRSASETGAAPVESTAALAAPPAGLDPNERDIRVETADVIAVFTNRGARLKSWRLKRYLDDAQQPLELVSVELSNTQPLPFSLSTADEALTKTLNSAVYAVSGAPAGNTIVSSPTQLKFEYHDSAGVQAVKEFSIEPSSYVVAFRTLVRHADRDVTPTIHWGPAVSLSSHQASTYGIYAKQAGGLIYQDGELQRLYASDVATRLVYEGTFRYAGVDDHYFVTMAVAPGASKVSFRPVAVPPPAGSADEPAIELMAWSLESVGTATPVKFFAGPKDFEVLAAIDRDLVKAIDFGWFAFIVVPLLRSLNWINGYVGNYGLSIILLTVLINAVMFPLRHKSVVSMRKMQEIQPEVKAIQERYSKLKATDPAKQKMNQEVMSLYRERGVNPAGGCVPMLLTLPVFFAFYSLLTVAIELRGAPFLGWIQDLSRPDPLYVTPVLMGITQFWQMRITPQTGMDPVQQKMMMVMPLIFMVFFLWTSAGALLYWLVSNVWGIGQQYLTNYLIGPPTVRTVRPAAERRLKRVGSGKTEAAARED